MQDPSSWRKVNNDRPWYKAAVQLLPANKKIKIIDIGAGAGNFAKIIQKRGYKRIECADGSPEYVKLLKKNGFKSYLFDFNKKFPLKKEYYDLVVALEVIEHLELAENFLNEVSRITKKNGHILLSTPNYAWFGYRIRGLLGMPPPQEGYHIRFFTSHTLRKKLLNADFEILKTNSFMPLPYINRLLMIFFNKQIWLRTEVLQNIFAQDLVVLAKKL